MTVRSQEDLRVFGHLRETFRFQCRQCGECCRTATAVLSTYDMVRLRYGTKMTTGRILEAGYVEVTFLPLRWLTPLPALNYLFELFDLPKERVPVGVIKHRTLPDGSKGCPFLTRAGEGRALCGIHEHRPAVCRCYPLGLLKRNGGLWFLQRVKCMRDSDTLWTVKEWIEGQGLQDYLYWTSAYGELMESMRQNRPQQESGWSEEAVRILYDFDTLLGKLPADILGDERKDFADIRSLTVG